MSVLVLANNDVGLCRFRSRLLQELLKEKEVIIALPKGEMIEQLTRLGCEFLEIDVDRRGVNPVRDFLLLMKYTATLGRVHPEYVITYTIKPNIYGGLACRLTRIPYFVNITGLGSAFQKDGIVKTIAKALYRLSLREAKAVFFENSANLDYFVENRIVSEEKCCLLNGAGVDLALFPAIPYPNNEVFQFLYIGRVMKEKGIVELLQACDLLASEGKSLLLEVVGPCEEEDMTFIMKDYVNREWFSYLGFQNDVRPFIARADCFVLPSYHEGMANTNLECASSGRPVITTNIPGCAEAVIDGKTGFLCKPESVKELYRAMKKMIELPRNTRIEMGLLGRIHMERSFDKEMVVHDTLKTIHSCL